MGEQQDKKTTAELLEMEQGIEDQFEALDQEYQIKKKKLHDLSSELNKLLWADKGYVLGKIRDWDVDRYYECPLYHASEQLKDDDDVIREAVTRNGSSIEYASDRLRHNEEFALLAIKTWNSWTHPDHSFSKLPDKLKDDEEFLMKAYDVNPNIEYEYLNQDWQCKIEAIDDERGDNNPIRYLKAKRSYETLMNGVEIGKNHEDNEPEQTPKFKI